MKSCLRRLHHDMSPEEIIIIKLSDDYELTIRKNDKVTSSGELIVIVRDNGRKVVINPQRILFFYVREDYLWVTDQYD